MEPDLLTARGARAVVIATARHVAGSLLPDVPAAEHTANELARVYVERCGLDGANLTVLLNPVGPGALVRELQKVAAAATDALVVHFVGHGVVGPDNELYLAMHATDDLAEPLLHHRALRYADLRHVVENCRARSVLLVLDCCFSGRAGGLDPVRPSMAGSMRDGVYLMASAGADEVAWAPDDHEPTAFSGALIGLLDNGDPTGPSLFTLDHVFGKVSSELDGLGYSTPVCFATGGAKQWRLAANPAWREPDAAVQEATREPDPPAGESTGHQAPYRGLAYFRPEHADFFFGRGELTRDLVDRLRNEGPLLVLGPSGVGKSSLLRAGLLPAVTRLDRWACRVVTPGADPFAPLARWLNERGQGPVPTSAGALRADPDELAVRLHAAARATGEQVVLVVDQFEDLFTAGADEDTRRAYVRALVNASRGRVRVVIGVRAGFFGHCARYPELLPALGQPVVVAPLNPDQLREVIEEPARKAGLNLEPGLVDRLLTDLGDLTGSRGSLPLLSHALFETWEQRSGNRLTLTGYHRTGGIGRAVAQTADAVYDQLDPDSRDVARRLLLRLVRIGDGTEDLRRRVPLSELDWPGARAVLDALVRARLVSDDQDSAEIAHDALLRAWPRLRTWITADRAGLLVRQQLSEAAADWRRHGGDPEYLYPASRLAEVSAWERERQSRDPVGEVEAEFLDASRRHRRRDSRRKRVWVAVLAVASLVAVSAAVYATWQQEVAADQRGDAEQSRNRAVSLLIARTSGDIRHTDPTLAMQLGVAAFRTDRTADARSALLSSVTIPVPAVVAGHGNAVDGVAFDDRDGVLVTGSEDETAKLWDVRTDPHHPRLLGTLTGHDGIVYDVAVAPHDPVVATASGDHTAKLWNVGGTEPRLLSTLAEHTGSVRGLAFSPDGARLATAAEDGTAILWDVTDPEEPERLSAVGHDRPVRSASFSPDGLTLATASSDGTARLWSLADPADPDHLSTLVGHADTVRMVPFNADGTMVATASNDRTVKLWDVTDRTEPREVATLGGHGDAVRGVAFSRDGATVATASADKTAKLWEIANPDAPVATLAGHTNAVNAVAFTGDGRTLATASADRTVKLWDVGDTRHPATLLPALSAHTDTVRGVAFSRDRATLATASEDGTAILWDVREPGVRRELARLPGHTRMVNSAAFSLDGTLLVTASDDRTARLWDVTDRTEPHLLSVLPEHPDTVKGAVFNHDGTLVVTVSGDGQGRLWDVDHPRQPRMLGKLVDHDSYLLAVAISQDGRTVATGSNDHTVKLWDVTDHRNPILLATIDEHMSPVKGVAFSPDGRTLATASEDQSVKLWNVAEPRDPVELASLDGHLAPVHGVAFSPDGRSVATASDDRTAKVWDVTDPRNPRMSATLVGHAGPVYGVALGDGVLATASWDGTAQLWLTDEATVADLVCRTVNTRATDQEWSQVLPDVPPQSACS